ncbi:MAG: PQQ-binding-like beta-propeller repeat protein [Phycisphaerae bacterium]|nr:PQQ-binding-like beta-propeller repeat protein [Phycisphaerae bacterium]
MKQMYTIAIAGVLCFFCGVSHGVEVTELPLETKDIRGLCIVLPGSSESLVKTLGRNASSATVQLLCRDDEELCALRQSIRALDVYGRISAISWQGASLPYIDDLVNVIIAPSRSAASPDEVRRVLCPGGSAYVYEDGHWQRETKPWSQDIDEWTHWLHDPSGNAVSGDRKVGPPRFYQWTAKPYWSNHHDTVLSTSAMVSANGRLFYIADESPSGVFSEAYEGQWFLIARDAFNGVLLWKIPISNWGWKTWGKRYNIRFAQPTQLPWRLVATGDVVYATLDFHAPVLAIDAATGSTIRTYEHSRCTDELLYYNGSLIISAYDESSFAPPAETTSHVPKRTTKPRVVPKTIRVLDAQTGDIVWEKGAFLGLPTRYDASEGFDPVYLTACKNRVVFATRDKIHCLDLKSGETIWEFARPAREGYRLALGVRMSENCTLVNHKDVVLYAQPQNKRDGTYHTIYCDLYAISAKTGKVLWKKTCGAWAWGSPPDVFVIDNNVWVHEYIPGLQFKGSDVVDVNSVPYALIGLDLYSGEETRRIPTKDVFHIAHHHRCYRNKATERFILTARRGTEFTELASGEQSIHHYLRSQCRLGVMPANGLLYTTPHPCGCYAGVLLKGYNALCATRALNALEKPSEQPRLVRGTAYSRDIRAGTPSATDWPTHRSDIGRSGFLPTTLPSKLAEDWRIQLQAPVSAATVHDGRVFVAQKNRHTITVLSAGAGDRLWEFTAGGRIDSPPTIHNGRALFGSADGWVYCLDASDGALIWRFRAAPQEWLMGVDSQLESVWPVPGSVLAKGDHVYFVAGRSSYLDGGLHAYQLDVKTGRVIAHERVSHSELTKAGDPALASAFTVPGVTNDVLVGDKNAIHLQTQPVFGQSGERAHFLSATGGLLDDTRFNRMFWNLNGLPGAWASLLVYDDVAFYGFRAFSNTKRGLFHLAGSGYELISASRSVAHEEEAKRHARLQNADPSQPKTESILWKRSVSIRISAMAVTKQTLLLAGVPDKVEPQDPYAAFEGRMGGVLLILDKKTGQTLSEILLESPPVWDGMSIAGDRIFLALENGSVVCLGE